MSYGKNNIQKQKGIIVTYILVFGAIFLMLLSGLLGFILLQLRGAEGKLSWNEALDIAESGIDRYHWCLNGGVESNCIGQKDFTDKDGSVVGHYSVSATTTSACGQKIQDTVVSTGWTDKFPAVRRKVAAIFAHKSVAAYSGIISGGVWFGNNEALSGPFMANGGVRMDGPNQSTVSSAALLNGAGEWVCDSTYGCGTCPTGSGKCRTSAGKCICPGVFSTTANSDSDLFQFPVPPFDFNSITIDLANIKDRAQNGGGIYLPRSNTINANGKGYHIKFQSNGTAQVYLITALAATSGYNATARAWRDDYFTITDEYLYQTYNVPVACSAIYAEDNVWPEGVVKGKVSLASANLIDGNGNTNAVLGANITYATNTGGDGFTLISQGGISIGPQSPDTMELHGIFVGQNAPFDRDDFSGNIKTNFTLYGSYICAGRPNETWVYSNGSVESGYRNTAVYYDANLIYNPPPFVASMSPDFKIVSWKEIN